MAKRFLDIITSLFVLIMTLPITLVTMILISKKLGKPVLFKQTRPGKMKTFRHL